MFSKRIGGNGELEITLTLMYPAEPYRGVLYSLTYSNRLNIPTITLAGRQEVLLFPEEQVQQFETALIYEKIPLAANLLSDNNQNEKHSNAISFLRDYGHIIHQRILARENAAIQSFKDVCRNQTKFNIHIMLKNNGLFNGQEKLRRRSYEHVCSDEKNDDYVNFLVDSGLHKRRL